MNPPNTTPARVLERRLAERLAPVSDAPDFEARELLNRFCGLSREELLSGRGELPLQGEADALSAVQRRLAGEPLQYILGEWDFYGRTFSVGEGVLIPRADTETLVEAVLEKAGEIITSRRTVQEAPDAAPFIIGDMCSGSGCIAVTLALELPGAKVYALEKSLAALRYLQKNAKVLGAPVAVREEDVLSPKGDYPQFDMIVSNPPYLTGEDMRLLQAEVSREPKMALYGGEDGLSFYRMIPAVWKQSLKPGGWLFFEVGMGQADAVQKILENNCFKKVCFRRDLCGIIRVVGGQRAAENRD